MVGETNGESAESPFISYAPRDEAVLGSEVVSRMFKAYLDRLCKERDAISNSL